MRYMRLRIALAAGIAALTASFLPAQEAAQPSIPGVTWDELTLAIRAVENARKADEAMAAYARGCTINRQSAKLQNAYLRKMLQFGRPDIAQYPSRELLNLDPKNGLAPGTLAYLQAMREMYAQALPLGVRAAALAPDNPSIVRNAAQLVAWYEVGKRQGVDAATKDAITELQASSAFAGAVKKAKEGYATLAQEKEAKKKEAAAADTEAKKLESKLKQVSDQVKSKASSGEAAVASLDRAKDDLRRNDDRIRTAADYRARQSYEQQRDNLIRRIRQLDNNVSDLVAEVKKLRKDRDDLEKQSKAKREQANRLLRQANSMEEGVPTTFRWQPPAVDGAVTADATLASVKTTGEDALPSPSVLVPDAKTPPPSSLNDRVAEAEAADKLSLAKLCLGSNDPNMRQKGKDLLAEILMNYAGSAAAADAKELAAKATAASQPQE